MNTLVSGNRVVLAGSAAGFLLLLAGLYFIRGPAGVLAPLGAAGLIYGGSKLYSNTAGVVAAFLFVAVNLFFFRVGDGTLNLGVLVGAVLLVMLLLRIIPMRNPSPAPRLENWFIVFLAAAGISLLVSVYPLQSIKRFGREVQFFLLLAVMLRLRPDAGSLKLLLYAILLSTVIPCLLGVAGYVFHIPAFLGQELYMESLHQGESRVQSTTSHPITLSLYLTVTLTLTLSLLSSGKLVPRAVTLPLALLQAVTLYLTYGRSGWAAFAVAGLSLLWIQGRRKILFLLIPAGLVMGWLFLPNLQDRVLTAATTTNNNSLIWRLGLWEHALSMYPAKPIFGSGIGTFTDYVNYLGGFPPHSTFVGLMVETGIVGTLAFGALLIATGLQLRRAMRKVSGEWAAVAQATLAIWAGLLVGTLGSVALALPEVANYFWVLVGITVLASRLPTQDLSLSGTSTG